MDNHPEVQPPSRRGFFYWFTWALGTVGAAILLVPFVGYLFGTRKRKVKWVTLGKTSEFKVNETRLVTFDNKIRQPWDGITAHTGVYVRRLRESPSKSNESKDADKPEFLVLAVNCAHLGCPVSWFQQSGLFLCPCHGGVYYSNGERASGPPPRGLFECVWRITESDQLEVQAPHYPTLQDPLKQG
jgi:Rieske Fe-S protein